MTSPTTKDDKWMLYFSELQNFKAEHGHCNVPRTSKDNPELGKWVLNQRSYYKKVVEGSRKLTDGFNQERIEMLEEIGFCWSAKNLEETKAARDLWMHHFAELQKYKGKHGHCNVPQRSKTDPALGSWVTKQRLYYKNFAEGNGKWTGHMSQTRIEMLEGLGFCWCVGREARRFDDWMAQFTKLKEYKAEHGHCNVPFLFDQIPKLGRWVSTQRYHYKNFMEQNGGKVGSINQTRIQMLEEIGFSWSEKDDGWMTQFAKLKDFKAKHGHCNVPFKYKDDRKLGNWVSMQRYTYKNFKEGNGGRIGNMSQATIDMLEEIGFCWSVPNDWMIRFAELKDYKAEHGHCNVPTRFPKLGNWVSTQRDRYKNFMEGNGKKTGEMCQERIELLEEIGFIWSVGSGPKSSAKAEAETEKESGPEADGTDPSVLTRDNSEDSKTSEGGMRQSGSVSPESASLLF